MNLGRTATVDDLVAFNQQLIKLVEAGLPIELGDGSPSEAIVARLEQIQNRIGLQVGRGVSIAQALVDDPLVPTAYRAAWETWFHGNRPVEALNGLTSQGEARREMQINVGSALVQPLILLTLVYFGFMYLAVIASAQLEATYQQIHETPSLSLQALIVAREWLPVWGILVPIAVAGVVVFWLTRSASWSYAWLPGRKRYINAISKATYAENVARLVEANHSLDESLSLLGPFNAKEPHTIASAESAQETTSTAERFPALMRWAFEADISTNLESNSRASLLRFAARTYRATAVREVERWRTWLPMLVGVLIGGGLVLFYGLSLFAPIIELLKMLTKP